jgi:hypothetical protein
VFRLEVIYVFGLRVKRIGSNLQVDQRSMSIAPSVSNGMQKQTVHNYLLGNLPTPDILLYNIRSWRPLNRKLVALSSDMNLSLPVDHFHFKGGCGWKETGRPPNPNHQFPDWNFERNQKHRSCHNLKREMGLKVTLYSKPTISLKEVKENRPDSKSCLDFGSWPYRRETRSEVN